MKLSRITAILLAAVLLVTASVFPLSANAATGTSNLNKIQTYFLRVIGSLSRADYYKNDVLASITVSQAIYESGWARYSLPVGGRNLFGMKAFSTWGGKVYDQSGNTLYASYNDFLLIKGQSYINTVSGWRAYDSWSESVDAHSSLFVNNSRYSKVVGEKDYKVAAQAIVDAGYCSDNGYVNMLCNIVEQYGLSEYNDITPDSDGIVSLLPEEERVLLDIGEKHTVSLYTVPEGLTPSSVAWKSDNEAVATVDENGCVTALAHGTTLISAELGNGREACCIIYVDCNATVMDSDVYVRSEPNASASNNGKFLRGTAIKVNSESVFTDPSGNRFYSVRGYNSSGKLVEGYASVNCIYLNKCSTVGISVVKDDITLKKGSSYSVLAAAYPADAVDRDFSWTSSNKSVATVDENGTIKAVSNGSAVVTVSCANGASKEIKVTVAASEKEYKAIVSSYSTINVRSAPDASASSVGKIPFLSEITVYGEPVGVWYKVSGKTSAGKTVTGYSNSSYIRLMRDGETASRGKASAGIKVYDAKDTSAYSFGTLAEGSEYCAIGETVDGWTYIVGTKKPSDLTAVYGYARLTGSSGGDDPVTGDSPVHWYGTASASLRVRKGAGTDYDTVTILSEGEKVIVTGDAEDGWYKVSGTDGDGKAFNGYCSAEYITPIYVASVNTKIHVRNQRSTSGTSLGTLAKGAQITVFGEAINGWYAVEGKDSSSGKTLNGYSSADYITIIGKLEAVVESEKGFGLTDASLSISDGILSGVKAGTSVSALLKSFSGNISVVDSTGKVISGDDLVGTGCVVRAVNNGEITDTATVIVMGDVNGDGVIGVNDYSLIKRSFLNSYSLDGNYLSAALVSGRDTLTVADYMIIKRVVLGTYKL